MEKDSDTREEEVPVKGKVSLAAIQKAIDYNILLDQKYESYERHLTEKLRCCREQLKVSRYWSSVGIEHYLDSDDEDEELGSCFHPYFKDKDGTPAPIYKQASPVHPWTTGDKTDFLKLIYVMSVDIRKRELEKQIAQLQGDKKSNDQGEVTPEITDLKKQMEDLDKKPLCEVALGIDEEYDWETLASRANYKHKANEYRALWKYVLHPSINKNPWSEIEHTQLHQLAQSSNEQTWDNIAQELNTGRTGYQCFVYYKMAGPIWSGA